MVKKRKNLKRKTYQNKNDAQSKLIYQISVSLILILVVFIMSKIELDAAKNFCLNFKTALNENYDIEKIKNIFLSAESTISDIKNNAANTFNNTDSSNEDTDTSENNTDNSLSENNAAVEVINMTTDVVECADDGITSENEIKNYLPPE